MSKIISVILAVTFSFFVFVGMTVLIKPKAMGVEPAESVPPITFKYEIDEEEPIRRKRVLPKEPEEPEEPKIATTTIDSNKPDTRVAAVDFKVPTHVNNEGFNVNGLANLMNSGSGDAPGPQVRIDPRYPPVAASQGIEGFVTLTFDISELGKPENIAVVDAKPRGVFEKSARRALRKWKYDPKKVNDKAVSQLGQSVTLVFQLESELL